MTPQEDFQLAIRTITEAFKNLMAVLERLRPPEPAPITRRTIDLGDGVTATLVLVPPGKFMMGSPEDEPGRVSDEPLREVEIKDAYWIWETPMTQEQYLAIVGNNPSHFRGEENLPVECVSWFDCVAACQRLTERTAGQYPDMGAFTLPTEALWEYACRAGTTGPVNVKGAKLGDVAWYAENSGNKTHPVGLKLPNAFGLYDMQGNVCVWCADEYRQG
jgi:formylglycine-generating enzyme required for sulfatase activity